MSNFCIGGVELTAKGVDVCLPHSAEEIEDCTATDLFSPPRQDWITGDDAYLRK